MTRHRLFCLLLFVLVSVPGLLFADFTRIELVEPDTSVYTSCSDQRVIIRIVSTDGVDTMSLGVIANGTLYDISSPELSWSDASQSLEFNPSGSDVFTDGTASITLLPVYDLIGAHSDTVTFSFRVDRTAPVLSNAVPSGTTVSSLSFEIAFDLNDPVVSGVASGLNQTSVSVTFPGHPEQLPLTTTSTGVSWNGTRFSFNAAQTSLVLNDGEVLTVSVNVCDMATGCEPNCEQYSFSFTMGETPCYREPNPITPNGDGKNDQAEFRFPQMRKSGTNKSLFIYDLKGGLVREMTAPGTGGTWIWDGTDDKGKPCAQGTFIYVLVVDDESVCDGTITILR